jgi:hypothetical protein
MNLSLEHKSLFALFSFPVFGYKVGVYDLNKKCYVLNINDTFLYAPIVWMIEFKPFSINRFRLQLKKISAPNTSSKEFKHFTLNIPPLEFKQTPSKMLKPETFIYSQSYKVLHSSVIPKVTINTITENITSESRVIITRKIQSNSIFNHN